MEGEERERSLLTEPHYTHISKTATHTQCLGQAEGENKTEGLGMAGRRFKKIVLPCSPPPPPLVTLIR